MLQKMKLQIYFIYKIFFKLYLFTVFYIKISEKKTLLPIFNFSNFILEKFILSYFSCEKCLLFQNIKKASLVSTSNCFHVEKRNEHFTQERGLQSKNGILEYVYVCAYIFPTINYERRVEQLPTRRSATVIGFPRCRFKFYEVPLR